MSSKFLFYYSKQNQEQVLTGLNTDFITEIKVKFIKTKGIYLEIFKQSGYVTVSVEDILHVVSPPFSAVLVFECKRLAKEHSISLPQWIQVPKD